MPNLKQCVLVVDDRTETRRSLSDLLIYSGYDVNLVPRFVRQGFDPNYPTARTFLDACLNMDQWATVKSVTNYLGYWDNLSDTDSGSLITCFQNMNAAIPHNTIPETDQFTFMGTVLGFRSRGYFPR